VLHIKTLTITRYSFQLLAAIMYIGGV